MGADVGDAMVSALDLEGRASANTPIDTQAVDPESFNQRERVVVGIAREELRIKLTMTDQVVSLLRHGAKHSDG